MTAFSLSIEHFIAAADQGDMTAMQRLGRLGCMYEVLAGQILDGLSQNDHPVAVKSIAQIGVAHEGQSLKAFQILSQLNQDFADHGIADIARAHPKYISQAIELLGEHQSYAASQGLRVIAWDHPEFTSPVLDKLKVMKHNSASFDISMLCRRNREYAQEGIEALVFRGDDLAIRHIIDIGEAVPQVALFARQTAVRLFSGLNDKNHSAASIRSGIERLDNKIQQIVTQPSAPLAAPAIS